MIFVVSCIYVTLNFYDKHLDLTTPLYYICKNNALGNSNRALEYKLAFYRYRYNITMSDDFELCIARISQCDLSNHQLAMVNNLSLLISVRGGDHLLHVLGFTSFEITELIDELAII